MANDQCFTRVNMNAVFAEFDRELPYLKALNLTTRSEKRREAYEIYLAAASYGLTNWIVYLHQSRDDWKLLLFALMDFKTPITDLVTAVANSGNVQCLRLLLEYGHSAQDKEAALAAMNANSFDSFKLLHEHGCPWDGKVLEAALLKEDVRYYQFMRQKECCPSWDSNTATNVVVAKKAGKLQLALQHGCPVPTTIERDAGLAGDVAILRVLHEHGVQWTGSGMKAAQSRGHMVCMLYFREFGFLWDEPAAALSFLRDATGHMLTRALALGCQVTADTATQAVKMNSVTCLAILHQHGCPWDVSATVAAVQGGYLDCLQYLHEHGGTVVSDACTVAARYGKLLCLQYLHEHRIPWEASACDAAIQGGHVDSLQYLHEHGCPWGKELCHCDLHFRTPRRVACVSYAIQHGCPVSAETVLAAIKGECLEGLRLLHQQGCTWNDQALAVAVQYKSWSCLQYLHDQGCPWPANSAFKLVQAGDVDRLRGVLACGYPAPKGLMIYAVSLGCVEALRVLHEHGCPWDEHTTAVAAGAAHAVCLTYAVEHRCPADEDALKIYMELTTRAVLDRLHLLQQQCEEA